jgi:hypothetical protein
MYIRLVFLSILVMGSLSNAMETATEKKREVNCKKVERQKKYNALVEKQIYDNAKTQQLMCEGKFDEVEKYLQQVAQTNDANPMKINPKKLTKYTKIAALQHIHYQP